MNRSDVTINIFIGDRREVDQPGRQACSDPHCEKPHPVLVELREFLAVIGDLDAHVRADEDRPGQTIVTLPPDLDARAMAEYIAKRCEQNSRGPVLSGERVRASNYLRHGTSLRCDEPAATGDDSSVGAPTAEGGLDAAATTPPPAAASPNLWCRCKAQP